MSTRTKIAVALIVAQIAALAFMAGEREWVLRQGRIMYLRTAPVDPRDPMRGDYVRFDYEAAHAPRRLWRDGITGWGGAGWPEQRGIRNRRVFAHVQPDDEGIAQLVSVSDREPAEGTFLRARVTGIQPHGLDLRFGVEALFMEQGTARKLEESRNARAGVPLNIEVAVSPSGLAVMKGYRWEPLGITVTPDPVETATRTVPPGAPPPWTLRGVTVELKNHSTAPVAIVALPNAQSFRLVPNERWIEAPHRWAGENAPRPPPTAATVRVLQPGETYRERIDFTSSEWWLREKRTGAAGGWSEPMPWEKLNQRWSASFRFEYIPPTRAESAALPQANLIRHSRLTSRAFFASGRVD